MGGANYEPQLHYISNFRTSDLETTNFLLVQSLQLAQSRSRRVLLGTKERISSSCLAVLLGRIYEKAYNNSCNWATTMGSPWLAICAFLCVSLHVQLAWAQESKTYQVGDSAGWTYINASSGQPADYPAWAAKHQFFVNDVLRFSYEPTKQNIYLFPKKEHWDSCDLANGKLVDNGTAGFSDWFLPLEAYYNIASGIYCDKGQKFRILAVKKVGTGGIEAPIPAPSPLKSAPTPSRPLSPSKAPASDPFVALVTSPSLSPTPEVSASAPATWTQTLILAAAGLAAATILQL